MDDMGLGHIKHVNITRSYDDFFYFSEYPLDNEVDILIVRGKY